MEGECPECGTKNSEDTDFCKNCGRQIYYPGYKMGFDKCPNCSKVNSENALHCKECDADLLQPLIFESAEKYLKKFSKFDDEKLLFASEMKIPEYGDFKALFAITDKRIFFFKPKGLIRKERFNSCSFDDIEKIVFSQSSIIVLSDKSLPFIGDIYLNNSIRFIGPKNMFVAIMRPRYDKYISDIFLFLKKLAIKKNLTIQSIYHDYFNDVESVGILPEEWSLLPSERKRYVFISGQNSTGKKDSYYNIITDLRVIALDSDFKFCRGFIFPYDEIEEIIKHPYHIIIKRNEKNESSQNQDFNYIHEYDAYVNDSNLTENFINNLPMDKKFKVTYVK